MEADGRQTKSMLLGQVRDAVPVYGSGGFTSYTDDELRKQTSGWIEEGIRQVKMKVGREARHDQRRFSDSAIFALRSLVTRASRLCHCRYPPS